MLLSLNYVDSVSLALLLAVSVLAKRFAVKFSFLSANSASSARGSILSHRLTPCCRNDDAQCNLRRESW